LACFVQTTSPVILERIDEIIGAWLSALGETAESASGEYVFAEPDQQGALPGLDMWQELDDGYDCVETMADFSSISKNATAAPGAPTYSNTSLTVSLASLGDPSLSFYSEAGSSVSSLRTASMSIPSSPSDQIWGDITLRHPLYEPGGHLAIVQYSEPTTDEIPFQIPPIPSSLTNKFFNNDTTPSLPQNSNFSNPLFVEFDPEQIYSTHAGRDDDDDSTGYDCGGRYYNSADGYYNSDEHDEEANLNIGWGR